MPITSKLGGGGTPDDDSVTSAKIANDEILNEDINSNAAIAATKIHDGSISNTEFGYLDGVTSALQSQINGKQDLDSDLTALAGQSGTNTFPVRTGAGTISEETYIEGSFTPTVTLVGGAGNTVPVYTTNTGTYTQIGNLVKVTVTLKLDGGDEGAGTGQINVAIPVASNAALQIIPIAGNAYNNSTSYLLKGQIASGTSTIFLSRYTSINASTDFTGADQNNTDRELHLNFTYLAA